MNPLLAGLRKLFGTPRRPPAEPARGIADRAALDDLVARTGHPPAAAETLARRALPCLAIFAEPAGETPGRTRFGGIPDLPPGMAWPESEAMPLVFYAQVALSDAIRDAGAPDLPPNGLLSFFGAWAEDDDARIVTRVIHTPAGAPLAPASPPIGIKRFHPVGARLEPMLSFPDFDSALMEEIEQASPDADHLALLLGLCAPAKAIGQLFGHAQWHDDLREVIHFSSIGRPGQERLRIWESREAWEEAKKIESHLAGGRIYRPWSAADDDNVDWIQSHRAEIDAGVAGWRALLTIESNLAMDLWINDANAIYFFIPATDLAKADFANVQALATQS